MLKALKEFWVNISNNGIHAPFIHDPRTKKPSITLLFAYMTFVLALVSTILLHIWANLIVATGMSILFWVMAVVFYRIRNLDRVKMDLDDKSIELEGGSDNDDN